MVIGVSSIQLRGFNSSVVLVVSVVLFRHGPYSSRVIIVVIVMVVIIRIG